MLFFDRLKSFFDTLELKQYYTYVLAGLGALLLLIMLAMFYYYRSAMSLKRQLQEINKLRVTQVKQILAKADRIQREKEKIDIMLAEDPDFKLGEYLEQILSKNRLKEDVKQRREILIDEKYSENSIEFGLSDINMKQLVEFLADIETNKRVYAKRLEVKKNPQNTLDANSTIATLFPKSE